MTRLSLALFQSVKMPDLCTALKSFRARQTSPADTTAVGAPLIRTLDGGQIHWLRLRLAG
jgi:hypothetical protein